MTGPQKKRDLVIGIFGAGLALATLFLWIPGDIDTAVIDVWRRTTRIGDAMLPTFSAVGFLIACIGICIQALIRKDSTPARIVSPIFALLTIIILTLSLASIIYTGPLVVLAWFGDEFTYRQLLDQAPWKYIGFAIGGTLLVFSFISLIEQSFRRRNFLIAVLSTAAIAALYDIPFDTMLLPPNGDF